MPLSTMPASISDPRRVGQGRLRYWGCGVVVWIIASIIISHVTSTSRSDPWMQLLAGFVMGGLPSIGMVALLALFRASHSAIMGAACAFASLSLLTVALAADESFGIVYAFFFPAHSWVSRLAQLLRTGAAVSGWSVGLRPLFEFSPERSWGSMAGCGSFPVRRYLHVMAIKGPVMTISILANARCLLRKARGPRRSAALLIMFAVSIACPALDSHSQVPAATANRPRLIDLNFDRPITARNPESVEDFLKRTRQAIDDGADIEAEDEYGNTPLLNVLGWVAWSGGDWGANRIVALLLERGADPNQTHRNAYKMTPLHIAAFSLWPNVELIEMLCAAGADKTAVAKDGFGTPYEMTLRMDHPLSSGPPHAAGHLALIQLALKNCGQKK